MYNRVKGVVKMKIKEFTYFNKQTKLEIEKVNFGSINLLVGISGAGKTQILNNLYGIVEFAKGKVTIKDIGIIRAEIVFEVAQKVFTWNIETEQNEILEIVNEKLTIDDQVFFIRDKKSLNVDGNTLLPILPELSLLKVYGDYKDIKSLKDEMMHIIFPDLDGSMSREILENHSTLLTVPEHTLYPSNDVLSHLYRAYQVEKEKFLEIKEAFIEVFPNVLDLEFRYEEEEKEYPGGARKYVVKRYALYIQESNKIWVRQDDISSGMLKTLFHLTYFKLMDRETVIFIDEFENGLGINCMEEITNNIICADNMQFILTSHHPYIINNIGMNYWKVVSRQGNKVCTKTAKELNLGNSKHDAFFQLMNKLQYEGEI